MDGRTPVVRETYQAHAVLQAVDGLGQTAVPAVVDDDLVALRARDNVIAGGREVKAVDLVRVVVEHFGRFEATQSAVVELYLDERG